MTKPKNKHVIKGWVGKDMHMDDVIWFSDSCNTGRIYLTNNIYRTKADFLMFYTSRNCRRVKITVELI